MSAWMQAFLRSAPGRAAPASRGDLALRSLAGQLPAAGESRHVRDIEMSSDPRRPLRSALRANFGRAA
eukprot:5169901-Alexandrium_andersonii.AAC.1